MSHVRELFSHLDREMQVINRGDGTISHRYTRHVLLMAVTSVICALIGIMQIDWNSGDGIVPELSWFTGLALVVLLYDVMLVGTAVMGRVIWWMAHNYSQRPSLAHCMVFASHVATPLFLDGLVVLYPLVQLCALVGTVALFCTSYLLHLDIPNFLNVDREEGLSFSSSTLAIGVLMLGMLLALTVILQDYGHRLLQKILLRCTAGAGVSNAASPHGFSLMIVLFVRHDGVASLSKSLLRRCATRTREPLFECSSCRGFEFLYLAWPRC